MRRLVLPLLLAALLAGCGSSGGGRTPLVVDTDLSTDDVVALLYLAQRPDVDLRAVSVSGTGLVRCPVGARLTLDLLAAVGRPDVPVACGATYPLAGDDQFPPEWRDRADALFGLVLPRARRKPEAGGGVELLWHAIDGAQAKTTLLSLAPLTDTALLLRRHPDVRTRLAGITAMGGAVSAPGNIGAGHERVEYNLWIDPTAADAALTAGVPATLVPLDATNQAPATVSLYLVLQRYHLASAAAGAAWDLFNGTGLFTGGQYLWDPVAAQAVTNPAALTFAERQLRVVTGGGADHGRTVVAAAGAPVRVAIGLDRAAFERDLLRTLLGRTIPAQTPPRAARIVYDGTSVDYEGPVRSQPGTAIVDTVNRSGRTFAFAAGTLLEGKTVDDLRALAATLRGDFRAPSWFAVEATGSTPPHSTMTWLFPVAAGTKAIVATATGRPGGMVLGPVTVQALP